MVSRGNGSVSDAAYTSGTSGLAAGLCIALVLVLVLGLYTMRRRIFSPLTDNSARSVATLGHDTLTMGELRLVNLTNKRRSAFCHSPVCSQDGASRGSITSVPVSRECSICTEPYFEGTALRQLPCGHEFHRCCIDPWLLRRSGTCPWYVFKLSRSVTNCTILTCGRADNFCTTAVSELENSKNPCKSFLFHLAQYSHYLDDGIYLEECQQELSSHNPRTRCAA